MATDFGASRRNFLKIPQREIDTVNGYTREIESELKVEYIPSEIFDIILVFHWIAEYFISSSNDIQISDNGTTITKLHRYSESPWGNTSYCNQWIHSMNKVIVRWQFTLVETARRIKKMELNTWGLFKIGFASRDGQEEDEFCSYIDTPNYCYNPWKLIQVNGKYAGYRLNGHTRLIKPGDTFEIILNLIEKQGWIRKQGDAYVVFKDVEIGTDIEYKLVVSLFGEGYTLRLNEFDFIDEDKVDFNVLAVGEVNHVEREEDELELRLETLWGI